VKQHERETETAEVDCFVSDAVYTLYDHKMKTEIRKELSIYNANVISVDFK
jgi:hypothetical protein